jgi:hypothetical protein
MSKPRVFVLRGRKTDMFDYPSILKQVHAGQKLEDWIVFEGKRHVTDSFAKAEDDVLPVLVITDEGIIEHVYAKQFTLVIPFSQVEDLRFIIVDKGEFTLIQLYYVLNGKRFYWSPQPNFESVDLIYQRCIESHARYSLLHKGIEA